MPTRANPEPSVIIRILCSLLAVPVLSCVSLADTKAAMIGFTDGNAATQSALEDKFDALLNPSDQRAWLEQLSAEPNHVGSPHNKANAEFMLTKFREWGWDARIETFHVLYPTPLKVALEMDWPTRFAARLNEPAVEGDRTSGAKDVLPPYTVYGADGDVTAELVYVNQGMPDDYKELDRRGIDVKGRIVIARYGGGWRGLKPKLAHQHGAVGCIIYSDPRDDGYAMGDAYPKGGFRPADGLQRGSVGDLPIYPGDPLTPGVGATEDAKRLSIGEAKTLLKIPVLPISFADAQPLLMALEGPVAPPAWRGALPITYHIGPGPAKLHLTVESEWSQKPIYNVIAVMKGAEFPDEWIVRGNHHDGWVFGAWDPLSANVVLMAEAKAIGALAAAGTRPRRTLVYASWDGEEPGLLGSTEWVETHADELREKAVLYVNSDGNGRGFLHAGGSHSLQSFVNQVAGGVRDPQTGASVMERLRAKSLVDGIQKGADEEARKVSRRVAASGIVPLGALGTGSDYTPFLQHLGIASVDLGFTGEAESSGVYHSVYDSFDHFVRFGDPSFAYGVALAQTAGHLVLRVANADALPVRAGDFAETVGRYVDEVRKLADEMRDRTEYQNRLLDQKAFTLAADPTEKNVPPKREEVVPFLNFAPLDNAVAKLRKSAAAFDEAWARCTRSDGKPGEGSLNRANGLLRSLEATLLHPQGLPGRDWYRHMIYAPGLFTGYGAKTLPGVREAIEERRWAEVDQYVTIVAGVLDAYGARLDAAAAACRQ